MKIKKINDIISSAKDPTEKEMLSRILDLSYRAQKTYSTTYTDFMDPFLLGKIKSHRLELLGINYLSYGGLTDSERHIIGLAHEDLAIEEKDFPINFIEVSVNTGIGKPVSHRDYLGAIMGLGIEREKTGDLLIDKNTAYVTAHSDIAEYIIYTLDSVSRYGKVTCRHILKEDIPIIKQEYKTLNCTVSSARADAIIAEGFNMSRSKAAKLIKAQDAMCNGVIINQASPIEENDICTLRGHGKIKVGEIGSLTRKGRRRIKIHRYI